MTEPKTVTLRYFDKESEDSTSSTWKCHGKVGNEPCERIIVRKAGAGWTNTFNHVKSFHPEWEQDSKQSQLAFTASPVENVYCWIDWVTTNLKPFSFVEEEETRNYTKLKPICRNTLLKHMIGVTKQVEQKISNLLSGKKFSLLIDGWSKGSTYYLAIFAAYPEKTESSFATCLLTFTPLCDETSLDADQHIRTIAWVVQDLYKLQFSNVREWSGRNLP